MKAYISTSLLGVKINLQAEIEKDISFRELPSPFKHHLKRFAKSLVLELPEEDILDLLFGRATQVAQYLLFILKVRYPELCQMVVKKLVEIVFDRRIEHREMITQSASSAYIVEIIMMVASETRLSKIWTKYLKVTHTGLNSSSLIRLTLSWSFSLFCREASRISGATILPTLLSSD